MYTYIVWGWSMRRTQIYIDDKTYDFLKKESAQTGSTISEIIRESVQSRAAKKVKSMLSAAEGAFGLWKDRKMDVDAYVRKMRKDRKV